MQPANWDNFRVDSISPLTFVKRNAIHWELLRETLQRSRSGVLEVGVGSGAQSALLSRWVGRVTVVDNDMRILRASLPNLTRFGRAVETVGGDAFALPFRDQAFGVALSQGLFEHFANAEIARLLREQLRVCRSVVFSVPSVHYPRQDVGNERLMDAETWGRIVSDAVGPRFVVKARYYRGDLEALKYSFLAGKWLGSFSVLVSVDPVSI